jgi:hypothetical protein
MVQGEKNLVEGNKVYAESFTQGDLALPPAQKYAVCMHPHLSLFYFTDIDERSLQ